MNSRDNDDTNETNRPSSMGRDNESADMSDKNTEITFKTQIRGTNIPL